MDAYQEPVQGSSPSLRDHVLHAPKRLWKAFTTKDGLIGEYDYAFLFRPNLPFMKKPKRASPFFGLNDPMPIFLALLLGFQHALAMLAGIITPPLLISGQVGANLVQEDQQYLVSTALIVCGILSSIQISRFHVYGTQYYIGTGLLSVVGTSFAIVSVASGAFKQMYQTGFCPTAANGTPLPCPDGYGALLGTSCVCGLLEILISFLPPKALQKIFPPLVTGPTVTLIGVSLVQTGFEGWAGGSGDCASRPASGPYQLCPEVGAPHALPWGSAEFIGLGFSVYLTILLCERFGSPIMKSTAVVIGLLVGCIIAAACGYFSRSGIEEAPVASFIWVRTFKLTVYGPVVLPMLAIYIVNTMEAMGDITATSEVSRLEVTGPRYDSRIQGGLLSDGLSGILAGLFTLTPMSTFAQNNGVIALTRCANRKAGYAACFWLLVMGIFSKFAAALVAIPASVLGGMTTFLFGAVAVSGIKIISTVDFNRRARFVLTAALSVGFGATLVPKYRKPYPSDSRTAALTRLRSWFSYVFTYSGNNGALRGFLNAIELVMETGFVVTGLLCLILNLLIPQELEDDKDILRAPPLDHEAEMGSWSHNLVQQDVEIGKGPGGAERGVVDPIA